MKTDSATTVSITTTTVAPNRRSFRKMLKRFILFVTVPYLIIGVLLPETYYNRIKNVLDPMIPSPLREVTKTFVDKFMNVVPWNNKNKDTTNNNNPNRILQNENKLTTNQTEINNIVGQQCYERFVHLVSQQQQPNLDGTTTNKNPLADGTVSIVLHQNGESTPCGTTSSINLMEAFQFIFLNELTWNPTIMKLCSSQHDMNPKKVDEIFHDKYIFESFFTQVLNHVVKDTCSNQHDDIKKGSNYRQIPQQLGFYSYCDMGEEHTPLLSDHHNLVPIEISSSSSGTTTTTTKYLPCHFHNEQGVRVSTLSQFIQLILNPPSHDIPGVTDQDDSPITSTSTTPTTNVHNNDCTVEVDGSVTCPTGDGSTSTITTTKSSNQHKEIHLYAVPAGRVFLFAPSYIGQIISLPHVIGGLPNQPVYMRVISVEPKVFDILNFFSLEESNDLVQKALAETQESHRIKRSSTGARGYNLNDRRTSESGYDTTGPTAMKLKRRCFDVLGFDSYVESHADGLQILRYNLTKAYVPHMDWIDGNDNLEHDYESGWKGGNRYATILLYFTDLGENDGGETVFTEAWPIDLPESERKDVQTAIRELQDSPQGEVLVKGSWEEKMVAQCRTRLAIRPQSARAVLFYSQLPNGIPDPKSLHGGCPVLNGTKYAANLWVWNTPRDGYPGNPKNPKYKGGDETPVEDAPNKVLGTFINSGTDPAYEKAELYYIDQFWASLGFGDPPINVNTYPSHVWNVKVNGKTLKTFEITSAEPPKQEYTI